MHQKQHQRYRLVVDQIQTVLIIIGTVIVPIHILGFVHQRHDAWLCIIFIYPHIVCMAFHSFHAGHHRNAVHRIAIKFHSTMHQYQKLNAVYAPNTGSANGNWNAIRLHQRNHFHDSIRQIRLNCRQFKHRTQMKKPFKVQRNNA